MARCGCSPTCNCSLKAGNCTTVTGRGTTEDPYIIKVTVDNQTILCQGGKLVAKLNTIDTNTVDLTGDGTVSTPLKADVILTPNGNVPDPNTLGTGNLVKEIAGPGGGIYLSCEDVQDCVGAAIDVVTSDCLKYDDATNTISILICGEPNGIECAAPGVVPGCPAGGLSVIPSSDPNDTLTFGTDTRLFAPSAAIIPGDCMTFTGAGTQASPFVVSPQIAPELNGVECVPGQGLLVTPSSDANNFLVFGSDTRLYTRRCPLTLAGSQVLIGNAGPCFELVGGDCVTPLLATLRLSDDNCQGLVCRPDGLYVQNDQTNLPQSTEQVINFGPFGPFNGTIPYPNLVLTGPTCITITNPSPCRDMVVAGRLTGFADTGRTSGDFRLAFDMSESGNPAGPYFSVSQMGQSNPNPASRITSNATWDGNDFIIGPGASHTECFRLVFSAVGNVVNGRVFSGQVDFSLAARWAE